MGGMTATRLEAELRALVAEADPLDVPSELDLFGDLAPSPVVIQAEARGLEPRRPGRPEGARGRAALDVVKFLRATRRPALLALQDVADLSWGELARMLGCSTLDAAEFWRKCVAELLPYVERRQPLAVEVAPGALSVPVVVFTSEPVRADLAEGNPPLDGETVADRGEVSRSQSHDGPEPLADQWLSEPDPLIDSQSPHDDDV